MWAGVGGGGAAFVGDIEEHTNRVSKSVQLVGFIGLCAACFIKLHFQASQQQSRQN